MALQLIPTNDSRTPFPHTQFWLWQSTSDESAGVQLLKFRRPIRRCNRPARPVLPPRPDQKSHDPGVRGKGITSRMLPIDVTN
jgi:hypothetical protein